MGKDFSETRRKKRNFLAPKKKEKEREIPRRMDKSGQQRRTGRKDDYSAGDSGDWRTQNFDRTHITMEKNDEEEFVGSW